MDAVCAVIIVVVSLFRNAGEWIIFYLVYTVSVGLKTNYQYFSFII